MFFAHDGNLSAEIPAQEDRSPLGYSILFFIGRGGRNRTHAIPFGEESTTTIRRPHNLKSQTPSNKLQINLKLQASILKIGHWRLFGTCHLKFGI